MNTHEPISHFDSLKQIGYYIAYKDNKGVEQTFPIEASEMGDLQINWDSNELYVEGYCLFNDIKRYTEILPAVTNFYFKIKAQDFAQNTYEEEFIITRMERQLSGNKNLSVRITFIDRVYYYLGNTFVSKGYKNTTSTAIIKDIINDTKLFPKGLTRKTLNFFDSNVVYPELAIPTNKSFVAFIKTKEIRDGFSLIQSRKALTTISHNHLGEKYLPDYYGDGKGIKFTYDDVADEMNPFKIKNIKFLTTDNLLFNAALPDCVSYVFDQGNMSNLSYLKNDVGVYSNSIGDTSTLLAINSTTGFKRMEVTSQDSIKRFYKFKLLETSLIEITVAGQFFYELLWKVGLDLKSTADGFQGRMPHVNVAWHIIKIIDKYNGTNFNQVITLGRVGISNVSK
jgi:hypothetical protein